MANNPEESSAPMTPLEMTALHLQEQCLMSFREHKEELCRIAEHGPDDTDSDRSLCKRLALLTTGNLALSAHQHAATGD